MLNLFFFFIKLSKYYSTVAAQKWFLLWITITFYVVRYMRVTFDTCIRKIYFAPFYMCSMSKTFHDFFRETHDSRIHDANTKMYISLKYQFHLISLCEFTIKNDLNE